MKSHELAHLLLAQPDSDVFTHEPEYDQFFPLQFVTWHDGRAYLTPSYDANGYEAPSSGLTVESSLEQFARNEITVIGEPHPQWISDDGMARMVAAAIAPIASVEITEDPIDYSAEYRARFFPPHPFGNQG